MGIEGTSGRVLIKGLSSPGEMRMCEDVQKEVWGFPDREVVPVVELVSTCRAGGCIAGAFDGDEMAGFVYGHWGLDGNRDFYHYSRMLAVRAPWRGAGLGRTLKLHQRGFVLERGINLMRWTFDPLEGRNASLNLAGLGATAGEYIVDYYGMKEDALNRGLPTDRLYVKWILDGERAASRAEGGRGPDLSAIMEAAPFLACTGKRPDPELRPLPDAGEIRIEIPPDFQSMKKESPDLAFSWRSAVRKAFQAAFARGFEAVEFASAATSEGRRSAYLLSAGAPGI